mmetsp:Transcript_33219/g.32319  ORF Transcript_33219/g.32319 Transcript_33219/m.32319 type:complete len:224 (+) Transcript_33219:1183-1854(+)
MCATAVTSDGQIFALGGKEKLNYLKCTTEIVIDKMMRRLGHQEMTQKKEPIAYAYNKQIGLYDIIRRRDMQQEKACFGHHCTKREIYIAGGQDKTNFALAQVESFDIKRDAWKKLPPLNQGRNQPGLCLFRQRFLYCFGGLKELNSDIINVSALCDFVENIERLDVREGAHWEIVELKYGSGLAGHSFGVKQISFSKILIFGSYFQESYPFHSKMNVYAFDPD